MLCRVDLMGVGAVDRNGGVVGDTGQGVIARALVDVRGHVHQVADRRVLLAEALGHGQAAGGEGRFFDGMDVEVVGTGVELVLYQHPVEHLQRLVGVLGRLDVIGGRCGALPPFPGFQVEQRIGIQGRGIEVVGVGL